MLGDAQEIDMDRTIADDVEGDVLGQRALAIDHHDRIHEVAGHQQLHELALVDVDARGILLVAIDHGGDAAFTTKRREAPLPTCSRVSADSVSASLMCRFQCVKVKRSPARPPGMTLARNAGA
jgi:hypothetical protein